MMIPQNLCDGCSACCCGNRHELSNKRVPYFIKDASLHNVVPIMSNPDKSCSHITEDGLCGSYTRRPLVCELYPFFYYSINEIGYLGIAVRNDCKYGKFILDNLNDRDVIEKMKLAWIKIHDNLTETEKVSWVASNTYEILHLIHPSYFC